MIGSLEALFLATVAFVGGHFALSAEPLRRPLVRRLGEGQFLAAYSLIVAAAFAWMALAYGAAPRVEVWPPSPALAWLPAVAMPVALWLAVCAFTTRSPTLPGAFDTAARDAAPGIVRITRHPFLWGAIVWAVAHMLATGDAASLVMMGGIVVLAGGGMLHIDARKAARMGADWGPVLMTTSVVPFAAILAGRTTFDWAGIGWWRTLVAGALYIIAVWLHPLVLGVPAWPGG